MEQAAPVRRDRPSAGGAASDKTIVTGTANLAGKVTSIRWRAFPPLTTHTILSAGTVSGTLTPFLQ